MSDTQRDHRSDDRRFAPAKWVLKPADAEVTRRLAAELGLHPVAARVLASRGLVEPERAAKFLRPELTDLPDPFVMKDMLRAVDRITRAVRSGERITVYGDYDVDGVTATTSLVAFLAELRANVDFYVPKRLVEGYGLNPGAVDTLAERGTRLIVTVDCGVTAVDEVDRAARAGLDVVVVDHHRVPAELPRAVAVLNPHQPACPFPHKELSAVGVVFHLLMALRKRLREEGFFQGPREPNLRRYLDLVALGTIADVVPLVGANRVLVTHGLKVLSETDRPGLRALKEVAQVDGDMTAGQVGFRLGPRINAAGRLDDAATAVRLLLEEDRETARFLASQLDKANHDRQQIEKAITQQALSQAHARVDKLGDKLRGLVLAQDGWHPGVVGIVAARVVEKFHRPTVVIGMDGEGGKGSARSIEKFDMFAGLGQCATHLARYGGHAHAAGVHVERSKLKGFSAAFEAECARQLSPEDLAYVVKVDAEVESKDATLTLAEALAVLGPFGAGHPEPVLASKSGQVEGRVLIAKSGPDHLKFAIGGADAIAFGQSEQREKLRGRFKVAYQLKVDEWNGRRKASATVKAIDPA